MAIHYVAGNRILDQIAGAVSPTIPATYYFGLSTTSIADAGTGYTEPSTSGTAYARVAVDNNKTTFGNAAANSITTLISISFPESTASWGTITNVFIADASAVGTGNILYSGTLSLPTAVASGTVFYFGAGGVTFTLVNV
ncbi:MAG: hypothetical protein PHU53_06335 [Thermoplasmata archaeon]|nr:hypothetical protein [Thermoplasmata archaeon]